MTHLLDKALISIFLSFPEAILILLLGFALTNMRIEIKKTILIAMIEAIIVFAIKIIDINFGLHIIVQIITISLLVSIILDIKLYKACVPVLIGIFIKGVEQALFFSIVNQFIVIDYVKLSVDFRLSLIFNLPILLFSSLLLFIVKKKNFTLI